MPRNLDAAITISFAASRRKPARIYARGNIRGRQSCSHSNAICNHSFKKRIELRTQEQHTRCKIHRRNQSRPERPQPHPPHTRGTFHCRLQPLYTEKTQGFVLRLPPQNIAHATFMQPFQCDLQPQLQETHRTTHTRTTTPCKTHRRNQSRPERQQPHPPHTRGTFHRRLQPLYTEKIEGSCSGFLPKTWPMQHSCSHSNAICNHKLQETHRTTHTGTTTRCKTHRSNQLRPERQQPHPPHTRGTFSLPPAATLHGKTQGFLLRLPPQNIAHATFMQPFQCDLQPQLQETHRTTHTEQPLLAKHIEGTNRVRNDSSRTRRTHEVPFIAACSHFTTETRKVSCPGFLPKTWPMQHSCSHPNAICNHSFKKRIEVRTQEQPPVAKHIEGTNRVRNDRSRTRRTHEVPFIAACSHFTLYTEKRFRASASSRKHSPCNIHAAIAMHFAAFPSSPLPFVTTSHRHHFPSSPFPFVTTSQNHHTPLVTTSLRHHFPSSPPPFVTTSLSHHFPSSPLPLLTTSLRHPFPSSPLPLVTTSLCHHFPSSPLPFIAFYSFVMYCDTEPPFIALFFCDVFVMYWHHFTTLHQCQVSQFYLSVTRKVASQTPLIT